MHFRGGRETPDLSQNVGHRALTGISANNGPKTTSLKSVTETTFADDREDES